MHLKDASILIVDDEPELLEIMVEWFERVAGKVAYANNGAEAIALLTANHFDLIVTDIRMPVMDGITLLRNVRASGSRQPSIIFVSGFADIEAREAYNLGAEALMEKPIQRGDLISRAEQVLADRSELWSTPSLLSAATTLHGSFASLRSAQENSQIAFGRGGFCIETKQVLKAGLVNINLNFNADQYALSGQGIVRWVAHLEDQVGVEFTYVAEHSREHVLELTNGPSSFIPRTTRERDRIEMNAG